MNDVNGRAAESGGRAGEGHSGLADGVALMEALMPGENEVGRRFDSSPEGSNETEDLETEAEVGAGAATEAAGSGSESRSPEDGEGEEEGVEQEGTEGAEEREESGTEANEGNEEGEAEDPKQKAINERMGELTAKRKEAEEKLAAAAVEVEELKAKVAGYESNPGSRPAGYQSPLDRIDAVKEARAALVEAEATQKLCKRLLAGEPAGALAALREAKINISDEEGAVAYLRELAESLMEEKATKAATLAAVEFQAKQVIEGQRAQFSQMARVEYPWLGNPASAERKRFDQVMKGYPFLGEDPVAQLAVADMVAGILAREKRWAEKKAAGVAKGRELNAKTAKTAKAQVQVGRPRAVVASGGVGGGRGGSSIRDQALKDPGNEEARLRLLKEYAL